MTADQVLQAFRHDAPLLFLGAAIAAVGLLSALFSAIRRKLDPVLIYFALFAVLYGLRIWMASNLMMLTMQGSSLYPRLSAGLDFPVAIPEFFISLESALGVLGYGSLRCRRELPLHPYATLQQVGAGADASAYVITLIRAQSV